MKQLIIFIWLKVKEIAPVLGIIIAFLFCIFCGVVFMITVEQGFHSGIPNWFEIPVVVLGFCVFLAMVVGLAICGYSILVHEVPAWIKANWQKAGELAKKE